MWMADEDVTLEGLGTGVAPARTRRRRGIAHRRRCRRGCATGWRPRRGGSSWSRSWSSSAPSASARSPPAAEQSRERAAKAAQSQTEPLLVQAKNLYTSLSDANATVATGAAGRRCRNGGEPESLSERRGRRLRRAVGADPGGGNGGERPGGTRHDRDWASHLHRADRDGAGQQPPGIPDRRRLSAPGGVADDIPAASGRRPSLHDRSGAPEPGLPHRDRDLDAGHVRSRRRRSR